MNVAHPETYLSLFAGVGGLDLGLRIARSDVRCVGYCERDYSACETLASRMEEGSIDVAPIFTDIRTFPGELYRGRVAGIVAGFPCPDYSVAGRRAGIVGKHGQLWDELARTICIVGPDWLVLENVPGIYVPHPAGDGAILPAGLHFVFGDLARLGFDAEWMRLRASGVGASHGRARWICVAYRKGGRFGIVRQSPGSHNAGGELGESSGSRWEAAGSGPRQHEQDEPEPGCRELGDTHQPGLEGRDQRGLRSSDEWPSGAPGDSQLADTEHEPGSAEQRQDAGERPNGAEGDGSVLSDGSRQGGQLDYRNSARLPRTPPDAQSRREPDHESGPELPIFAPGPGAVDYWRDLLVWRPELRPAISPAEIESAVRYLDDGLASTLAGSRTDQLRACGNGVVSLQAALAITILSRRILKA